MHVTHAKVALSYDIALVQCPPLSALSNHYSVLDPVVWLLRNNSRMPLKETVCPYVPSAFIFLLLAFLLCIVNDLHILIKLNSVRLDSTFFPSIINSGPRQQSIRWFKNPLSICSHYLWEGRIYSFINSQGLINKPLFLCLQTGDQNPFF